jgi:hypothetical protein
MCAKGFQNWPTEWTQKGKTGMLGSTGLNCVAWIFLASPDFISLQIPYSFLAYSLLSHVKQI